MLFAVYSDGHAFMQTNLSKFIGENHLAYRKNMSGIRTFIRHRVSGQIVESENYILSRKYYRLSMSGGKNIVC